MSPVRGWVRLLLRLYPKDFREGYGAELIETFDELWREAGLLGRGLLVLRTSAGLVWGAWAERWASRRATGEVMRMKSWMREMALASRRLRRAPGFTLVTTLTIAAAVAALGSVFGVVSGVLLEEMPYEEPEELAWIWRDYWGDFPRGWLSGLDIAKLREYEDVFEGVAGVRAGRFNLSDGTATGASDVRVILGSPGYLKLLGVAPALGPGFSLARETGEGGGLLEEIVLRHGLWTRAFGSDPGVVGRTIFLNGDPFRVVGVMPPWFDFRQGSSLGVAVEADAYLTTLVDLNQENVYSGSFAGLARVRPEAPASVVNRALSEVAAVQDESFENRGLRLWTADVQDDLVGEFRRPLFAVLGAAGFLLLILGANLATLFLGRATEQSGSAAVRAALGAGRMDLLRSAVSEPVLVATAGLAIGGALAWLGTDLLAGTVQDTLPRIHEVDFDARVLGSVGLGVAVIAALSALGPIVHWMSARPSRALREGGGSGRSVGTERARASLVVLQVALALSLVMSAGLMFRTVQGLLSQDPGFDVDNSLTFRILVQGVAYDEEDARHEAQEALRTAFSGLPGVLDAGYANVLPLSLETNQTQAMFPDVPSDTPDPAGQLVDLFSVSPRYAESLGMRILEGRSLRDGDGPDGDGVVLIDDVLAGRYFPAGRAVGSIAVIQGDTLRIAGVVDQPRLYSVRQDDRGQVFLPSSLQARADTRYVLRIAAGVDGPSIMAGVRREVSTRVSGLAVSEVQSTADLVRTSLATERLNLRLALVFALSAVGLAGLGLYGIVSGMVIRRRREIGLRMALGADSRRVVANVLGSGVRLVALGTAIGVLLSVAISRWMSALLFGVQPLDPATLGAAAAMLLGTAMAAAWLPARRATRIAPSEALRAD